MRLLVVSLVIAIGLLAFVAPAPAAPHDKDNKENVVGAVWKYTLINEKSKMEGGFRVYRNEIFKQGRKIGRVVVKDNDETTLIFTDDPELNGKAVLAKAKNGVAQGTLKRDDGVQFHMYVTMVDQ
jgi:hypothetical protein